MALGKSTAQPLVQAASSQLAKKQGNMTFCRCLNMFQLGFGSFPSIFGHTHLVTEDGSIRQVHQLGSKHAATAKLLKLLSGFAHQLAILTDFHKFLPFAEHMAHGVDFYLPT